MKRILLLIALTVSAALAENAQERPMPSGCVHKNNDVYKCPLEGNDGAQIFDFNMKRMYVYMPENNRSASAYAAYKCKSFFPMPLKSWLDKHDMNEIKEDPNIFVDMIYSGNIRIVCDGLTTIMEVHCSVNHKDVRVKKFDEIGVLDDSYDTTTDDRRLCKSMFDENYY